MDHPAIVAPPRREFERFYRDHFAAIWRALARLGIVAAEREDVAQEVFVTAYRRWSTLREIDRPRAWLLGIARRIASRHRRGDERRARRTEVVATMVVPPSGLEDEVWRRAAWRSLQAFLDSLDVRSRDAFVLGELEQLSRPELALALGVQPSTAYSRLVAARRRFVDRFGTAAESTCAAILRADDDASPGEPMARGWIALAPMLVARPLALAAVVGKLALGLAAVGAVIVAAPPVLEVSRAVAVAEPAPAARAVAPLPAAVAPAPAIAIPEPPAPSATTRAVPLQRPRAAAPSPAVDPHAEEIALLTAARTAVLAGERARARALLDEHARRFTADSTLADLRRDIARDLDARTPIVRPTVRGDSSGQESP